MTFSGNRNTNANGTDVIISVFSSLVFIVLSVIAVYICITKYRDKRCLNTMNLNEKRTEMFINQLKKRLPPTYPLVKCISDELRKFLNATCKKMENNDNEEGDMCNFISWNKFSEEWKKHNAHTSQTDEDVLKSTLNELYDVIMPDQSDHNSDACISNEQNTNYFKASIISKTQHEKNGTVIYCIKVLANSSGSKQTGKEDLKAKSNQKTKRTAKVEHVTPTQNWEYSRDAEALNLLFDEHFQTGTPSLQKKISFSLTLACIYHDIAIELYEEIGRKSRETAKSALWEKQIQKVDAFVKTLQAKDPLDQSFINKAYNAMCNFRKQVVGTNKKLSQEDNRDNSMMRIRCQLDGLYLLFEEIFEEGTLSLETKISLSFLLAQNYHGIVFKHDGEMSRTDMEKTASFIKDCTYKTIRGEVIEFMEILSSKISSDIPFMTQAHRAMEDFLKQVVDDAIRNEDSNSDSDEMVSDAIGDENSNSGWKEIEHNYMQYLSHLQKSFCCKKHLRSNLIERALEDPPQISRETIDDFHERILDMICRLYTEKVESATEANER